MSESPARHLPEAAEHAGTQTAAATGGLPSFAGRG